MGLGSHQYSNTITPMKGSLLLKIIGFSMLAGTLVYGQFRPMLANASRKLPSLETQTLAGEELTFPQDLSGQVAVLCFPFKRSNLDQVDSWTEKLLPLETKTPLHYYEVPIAGEVCPENRVSVESAMMKSMDPARYDNVATHYGGRKTYLESLGVEHEGECLLVVLDEMGYIRYRVYGPATPEHWSRVKEVLTDLAAEARNA